MSDRKAPGRPRRVADRSDATVGTRVTASDYDRVCESAKASRVTVAEFLRRALQRTIRARP